MWIEIRIHPIISLNGESHSIRGVWIEIPIIFDIGVFLTVTPLGECGLKYTNQINLLIDISHSLRGVWIEIGTDYGFDKTSSSLP